MRDDSPLTALAVHFAILSLFAIGGANAAIPEMHRIAVDVMQWMTDRQFSDMFAMAQVSPGPNVIIVTLIGFHVAGVAGAAVATAAMVGPTCIAAYVMTRVWDRFRTAKWRIAIQAGLVPVALGLMAASVYVVAGAANPGPVAIGIALAAAITGYTGRFNPLWVFAVGAALGASGLL
ncbi:MAG: chromate transporter [Pseudolabrys sp.]